MKAIWSARSTNGRWEAEIISADPELCAAGDAAGDAAADAAYQRVSDKLIEILEAA